MPENSKQGTFIAVVGASGSGKDTILDGARAILHKTGQFYFPARFITRSNALGGEAYNGVSEAEFRQIESNGGISIGWNAHGLNYGLPREIENKIDEGINVVANVSRLAVKSIAAKFHPIIIVEITARPEIVLQRLKLRGRETHEEIEGRVARNVSEDWSLGLQIHTLENNASASEAVEKFIGMVLYLSNRNVAAA